MSVFHTPVMVAECIRLLGLKAEGVYVDATCGGGGHSLAMLKAEPKIKLFCFDQDASAIREAKNTLAREGEGQSSTAEVEFVQTNFVKVRTELALRKIKGIDGILFDLGVSSHQIDSGERGFSFDKDAPLDMRMDTGQTYSAFNAVNELDARALGKIFRNYGEENHSLRIAKAIEASPKPINTTRELAKIIESVVGSGTKESLKSKVRIFQALRIHVNGELDCLSQAVTDAINLLNPTGRIVVLSYHSLEDRIVKQAFRLAAQECICPPAIINCVCNHRRQLKYLTRRPLTASEEELSINVRSRSAKLRAAEKLGRNGKEELQSRKRNRYQKQGEK